MFLNPASRISFLVVARTCHSPAGCAAFVDTAPSEASRSRAASGDRFGMTGSTLGMVPGSRLAFGVRTGSPAAVDPAGTASRLRWRTPAHVGRR